MFNKRNHLIYCTRVIFFYLTLDNKTRRYAHIPTSKMDQQWKPVVFRKKPSSRSNANRTTHRVHNPVGHALGKLDDDTGTFEQSKRTTGAHAFKSKLQQERLRMRMSQRELAKKLNISEVLLKQYENGQVVPNNQTISRLERCIGCTLPRVRRSK